MELLEKQKLNNSEKTALLFLWNSEYPVNLNYSTLSEFKNYLEGLDDQFHLLVIIDDQIKGWYFDFLREDKRWFGLILSSDFQGRGMGTHILNLARRKRKELSGWIIPHHEYLKADGQPYKSPQEFYLKNGFKILNEIQLKTKKISAVKIEWKALM